MQTSQVAYCGEGEADDVVYKALLCIVWGQDVCPLPGIDVGHLTLRPDRPDIHRISSSIKHPPPLRLIASPPGDYTMPDTSLLFYNQSIIRRVVKRQDRSAVGQGIFKGEAL